MADSTADAPSLESLVDAANEVAKTARTLLTAMLAVAVGLTATMIAATDEALLRDAAEVVPTLGVQVKLSTAFLLAPPIFAFLHINALLQLHLLNRQHQMLGQALDRRGLIGRHHRLPWLRLVNGFAFAQLLAGDERWSLHRLLLAIMMWLTVVAVPVTLLLTAQISFVRYQSAAITLVQQLTLTADLATLGWFHAVTWNRFALHRALAMLWSALAVLSCLGLLWLSWLQAVPPQADEEVGEVRWTIPFGENPDIWAPVVTQGKNLLDRFAAVSAWPWTRRYLDLNHATLLDREAKRDRLDDFGTDEADRQQLRRHLLTLDLRNRILRFAVFDNARLFSADLRQITADKSSWQEARLEGAKMVGAQLAGADLFAAQMQGANLNFAQMQGANLNFAQMQGANLREAQMQGADLTAAQMQGANLREAQMQGANLFAAQMQDANLREAQMQDANLREAQMQGADLREAQMQGADLREAAMQGADLRGAEMQGADLSGAEMQGADLSGAEMQGANLRFAQMQGANLRFAQMQGADLSFAAMQGVEAEGADLSLAVGAVGSCDHAALSPPHDKAIPTWEELDETLRRAGLAEALVENILARHTDSPATCGKQRLDAIHPPPAPAAFAAIHRTLACAEAPIAQGIAQRTWLFPTPGETARAIAMLTALLKPPGADCPGLAALPPDERSQMRQTLDDLQNP